MLENKNISRRPLSIKSRVVVLRKFKLDLVRSLELLRFFFNTTGIDILNLILKDFLDIKNFCRYVVSFYQYKIDHKIELGVSLASSSCFSITSWYIFSSLTCPFWFCVCGLLRLIKIFLNYFNFKLNLKYFWLRLSFSLGAFNFRDFVFKSLTTVLWT